MRANIHIAIAMIVIPIYGIQVCPFIEALAPMQVIVPVVLAFAAHALCAPGSLIMPARKFRPIEYLS